MHVCGEKLGFHSNLHNIRWLMSSSEQRRPPPQDALVLVWGVTVTEIRSYNTLTFYCYAEDVQSDLFDPKFGEPKQESRGKQTPCWFSSRWEYFPLSTSYWNLALLSVMMASIFHDSSCNQIDLDVLCIPNLKTFAFILTKTFSASILYHRAAISANFCWHFSHFLLVSRWIW